MNFVILVGATQRRAYVRFLVGFHHDVP